MLSWNGPYRYLLSHFSPLDFDLLFIMNTILFICKLNLLCTKTNIPSCSIGIDFTYSSMDPSTISEGYYWHGTLDGMDNFRNGDVIAMELNVPKRKVLFYKNYKLSDKVFYDIDISKEYHLVIELDALNARDGDNIQLLDFNVQGRQSLTFYENK